MEFIRTWKCFSTSIYGRYIEKCLLKSMLCKTGYKQCVLLQNQVQDAGFSKMRRSCDRASWYISTVKLTRCTIFEFIEYHSTCLGRSFRPSSGVKDCTYSVRYMSFHLVPTSKQSPNLYDKYLILCVQSRTPDDGRKDCPKHVEWYCKLENCASSWFYRRNEK